MEEENAEKAVFSGPKFTAPKKYGLIIPSKTASKLNNQSKKPVVKPCIFDEDDDEDTNPVAVNKNFASKLQPPFKSVTSQNRLKKQTQIDIEKALNEDPNVFEYDNVYDDMEKEKFKVEQIKKSKSESKEPKYIVGIMKAAAKRQIEYEKIEERKIQKERAEEGDLWSDKEVFVTSAYRKKIEERELQEAEERNQDAIESLLDVRKQKDLSGFYSNLLKMRTGELVVEEEGAKDKRIEKEEAIRHRTELEKQKKKGYRAKRSEESSDEEEKVVEKVGVDEGGVLAEDVEFVKASETVESKMEVESVGTEEPLAKKTKLELENDVKVEVKVEVKEEEKEVEEEQVPKLTKEEKHALIFNKRTVGERFDREVAEFFLRKSSGLGSKSYVEREG